MTEVWMDEKRWLNSDEAWAKFEAIIGILTLRYTLLESVSGSRESGAISCAIYGCAVVLLTIASRALVRFWRAASWVLQQGLDWLVRLSGLWSTANIPSRVLGGGLGSGDGDSRFPSPSSFLTLCKCHTSCFNSPHCCLCQIWEAPRGCRFEGTSVQIVGPLLSGTSQMRGPKDNLF